MNTLLVFSDIYFRQAHIVHILQILFEYSEEAMKSQGIVVTVYVQYMIPPTYIAVFIGLIIVIPIFERIKIPELVIAITNRKGIRHTEYIIP